MAAIAHVHTEPGRASSYCTIGWLSSTAAWRLVHGAMWGGWKTRPDEKERRYGKRM